MKTIRTLAIAFLMTLSLATGSMAFTYSVAHAQVDTGLAAVGGTIGLSATDPRIIATRIINVSLGLLGIIMVSLILYAGFLWMTSGGEAEKIEKAKHMIRNAIIGVIIILSSWAIAIFVVNALMGATGTGSGTTGSGAPSGGSLPSTPGASGSLFQVQTIAPSGTSTIRNIEVRFIFTREIDASTANANLHISRVSDSTPVAGTIAVSGRTATFTPSAACPAPNGTRKCFDADTEYRAEIANGLKSSTGSTIVCGGFSPVCQANFTSGNLIDTEPPTAEITWPTDGTGVEAETAVPVSLRATDDAGVSYVSASADGAEFGIGSGPVGTISRNISPVVSWSTVGVALGPVSLRAKAHDIDSNTTDSATVTAIVRPSHCFNHALDTAEGETGTDCDAKTDVTSCGACIGGACTSGASCASGVCTAGICVEQPVITGVSPLDGRPGTMVTISGVNFGDTTGEIKFAGGIVATAPEACVTAGIPTWSRSQVVVIVPVGAGNGPMTLTNNAGLSDASSGDPLAGDRGPQIRDFTVNDVARPGLCGADPSSGLVGEPMSLAGAGLGTVSDKVYFNNSESDREISSFTGWVDNKISLPTPVYAPSLYAVRARSGGIDSNSIAYRINAPIVSVVPEIISLSPVNGPISEYVTIQGHNFGSSVGIVNFRRGTADVAVAATDFPAGCARSFWSDTSITVKVPATIHVPGTLLSTDPTIDPGAYEVEVVRGSVHSNTKPFTINTETPRPGICSIQPVAGPIGTPISIIGERFVSGSTVHFAGSSSARIPATVLSVGRTSSNLNTTVPTAISGNVIVTNGSATSNPAFFSVRNCNEDVSICSASGEICCRSGACSTGGICAASSPTAMFAWKLSTGILPVNPRVIEECSSDMSRLPSPSPWETRSGGSEVCVNADIYMRLNTPLNASTVTVGGSTPSLLVEKCTGTGATPCTATVAVPRTTDIPLVDTDGVEGVIRYRVQENLLPSTTYRVILTTAITSAVGYPMLPREECGTGNSYCFTFKTRASTDLCDVASVNVFPTPYTMKDIDETKGYSALPRAADACVVLRGDGYSWSWNTDSASIATVTNALRTTPPGAGTSVSENQTVTSHMETTSGPLHVSASVAGSVGSLPVTGRGDLFVSLVQPRVISYGPNCDKACMNAAIWARFNTPMRPGSISNDDIIIQPCRTENCRTFDPSLNLGSSRVELLSTTNTLLKIDPTRPVAGGGTELLLERGRFYKVTIKGGMSSILSRSGMPLATDFSWTFRVKDDVDARCVPESIAMSPGSKTESFVGARQSFSASPISGPTACNADGEPLVVDRPLTWSIQQTPTVSKYINGSHDDGVVDTNPIVGPGCTNRCTPHGADGLFGKTASCGNGMIETTDANYCRNGFPGTGPCVAGLAGCRTIHDDACQLLAPGSRGAEECEGSAITGCGSTCLWMPVAVSVPPPASPVCGNGTLNRGEQCDPGVPGTSGCSAECQFIGSTDAASVCGNGAIGDGEACDDGNMVSGDGCSSNCLHEGSSSVLALCGNGTIEPGETCDTAEAWCDHVTCLKIGTSACTPTGAINCCGNATKDNGEDCDGGDGCSNRCLALGSSTTYHDPSFCGDGVIGKGEIDACEEGIVGNGFPDPRQLAEIVGDNALTPADNGLMSSEIKVDYEGKTGLATYALQCGFTTEVSCNEYPGTGLDNNGCCAPRPALVDQYPPSDLTPAGLGICRNALISAKFNEPMEEASLTANFVVAERIASGVCPEGTTAALLPIDTAGMSWWKKAWFSVLSFFHVDTALAEVYCSGQVHGRLNITAADSTGGSLATFSLDRALKPLTKYRVTYVGDANLLDNPAGKQGIKTARGVVSNGSIVWTFRTGENICTISSLSVRDIGATHPNLFVKSGEFHKYLATPISLQDGHIVPLSTVAEYAWSWGAWHTSDNTVASITPSAVDLEIVTANNKNGASYISTGIQITHDEVTVPSTTNQIVRGSALATVFLCENPWPSATPFSDSQDSVTIPEMFRAGPFYNFSTIYCRDKGAQGIGDDLPGVNVVGVTPSALDVSLGVQRQYLLTYTEPHLAGDGIGIRVVINPLHLSASAWYASKGFSGSPKSITIDGYEALQDGNTVYIGAVNTNGISLGEINPVVYVFSRNPDAQPETVDIFDQMVKNLILNVNLQDDSQNSCVYAVPSGGSVSGADYVDASGNTASCTADWECLNKNASLRCASFKAKMQRDIKRIADFQRMTSALETSKTTNGKYPALQTGSFLQTLSNSRWPSWQGSFTSELGIAPPVDPVNRFLTCGICSGSSAPCMDASDCGAAETCKNRVGDAYAGIDASTCWNPTSHQFICPKLNTDNPYSVSRFYQYRALAGGVRFELSTELEGPSPDRYRPALLSEIRRCTNVDSLCNSDLDCVVPSPTGGAALSSGNCVATGGSWKYVDSCNETAYSADTVCGNGVRGPTEVCEIGDTHLTSCVPDAGSKLQVCNSTCSGFVDSSASVCVNNATCGNGRLDARQCLGGVGGYRYGQACNTIGSTSECLDPRDPALRAGESAMTCQALATPEVCDDGVLNGTYGRCNINCSGYGAYCGDGMLSPGESCDKGSANGTYTPTGTSPSETCSESCHGPAPYCGDGSITEPIEECDGSPEISAKAICIGGSRNMKTCDTVADCPGVDAAGAAAVCGGAFGMRIMNACTGALGLCSNDRSPCVTSAVCADGGECIQYPTQRVRSCRSIADVTDICRFDTWSECQPIGSCGNGSADPGEECDDGNGVNTDGCTNLCKRNVCGDTLVNVGVEECDNGTSNGTHSCSADYGSTCIDCSTTCRNVATSGGFCGNGVKEGSEQCDGRISSTDTVPSCRALGYDYAETYKCSRPSGDHMDIVNVTAEERTTAICRGAGVTVSENVSCNSSCGFSGCRRCSDTPGDGRIAGQVFDAVNYLFPVPNARVTLYSRGSRIGETFTSTSGTFAFNTINRNAECAQYRIVVDFYQDNSCTGAANADPLTPGVAATTCNGKRWPASWAAVDENINGGYWPYNSDVFGLSTFASNGIRNSQGKIFLVPRVGPNETLVVAGFNGSRSFSSYLVLPEDQAFRRNERYTDVYNATNNIPVDALGYDACTLNRSLTTGASGYAFEGGTFLCLRALYYRSQGNSDLSVRPYATLQCETEAGGAITRACSTSGDQVAPLVAKFKRGAVVSDGWYSYILDDLKSTQSPPALASFEEFRNSQAEVRIVTSDINYKVRPPETIDPPATCSPGPVPIPSTMGPTEGGAPYASADSWNSDSCGAYSNEAVNGRGKFWLVFQQNARTGEIRIPSDSDQWLCRESRIPNESPLIDPLPWPLTWSDCRYGVPRPKLTP